ncbi:MAG: ABC transporter ATP-binding protein [Ignisphaera sp.]
MSINSISVSNCNPLVRVNNLWFKYEDEYVLKNISLQIQRRELIIIMGPNGSGKSTFLKLLAGILKPEKEKIFICNSDVVELTDRDLAKLVGYVHQNPWFYIFNLKVFDEITFTAKNLGMDTNAVTRNVLDIATNLDIIDLLDKSPFSLSEGEARRVVIASALIHKPILLLLDEPTAGLDYGLKKKLVDIINRLIDVLESTIIIATHDVDIITMLTNARLIIFNRGEIVFEGSVEEALNNSKIFAENNLSTPIEIEMAKHLGIHWYKVVNFNNLLLEVNRLRETLCR